jgi:peptidoglycan hydrolase-like protein with peptidoglycan-binding domain
MDKLMQNRLVMAALGGLAGFSLYLLSEVLQYDSLPERVAFALTVFATVFFAAVLALAGPVRLRQSAGGAALVAAVVTLLLSWAGFRFEAIEGLFGGPMHAMAAFALCTLPLPFIIAWYGAGLRDYPTLFTEAWGIVVRSGTALVFTGLVWGVIALSDMLLDIVGLTVIQDLLELDAVPWLIAGVVLGIALAVVEELRDYISPNLILRLVRLLVPVVLVVMVVFCVALPIQGFAGVFDNLSAGATLLIMTGAGAALVSTAIDRDDVEATHSLLLAWSARALAVILPVPAGLGAYAIWLRVEQYGWTPERVFAALVAVMAMAYALLYCGAVLRRSAWMARVRQVNIWMAGALIVLSALWLTPLLNAERIAANSQIARLNAGALTAENLEPYDYEDWGLAGDDLLAALREKAKEPGQEALASRLASGAPEERRAERTAADIRRALIAEMPLQPTTATGARDAVLAVTDVGELGYWLDACRIVLPGGKPGCVMIIADLLPEEPGDEAVIGWYYSRDGTYGYATYEAVYVRDGFLQRRGVAGPIPGDGVAANDAAFMTALQAGPPVIKPAPLNMIDATGFRLMVQP